MDSHLLTGHIDADDRFQSALSNDSEAKLHEGVAYMNGDGVKKDCDKALQIFTEVAIEGNPEAEYAIGVLLLGGETHLGVNPSKASEWFLKAANKGIPEAQYSLGMLYKQGRGLAEDYDEAVKWLSAAKNQGHFTAAHHLYVLTADPSHLRVDPPQRPLPKSVKAIANSDEP